MILMKNVALEEPALFLSKSLSPYPTDAALLRNLDNVAYV